jgi:hypothetical protein
MLRPVCALHRNNSRPVIPPSLVDGAQHIVTETLAQHSPRLGVDAPERLAVNDAPVFVRADHLVGS